MTTDEVVEIATENSKSSTELATELGFKICQTASIGILLNIAKQEPVGHAYDLLHEAFTKIAELTL